ncbi:MAG: hypothetical protein WKG07_42945 [Hymenobacter sp.]
MLAPAPLIPPATVEALVHPTPAAERPDGALAGFPFETHLSLEPLIAYWHAREHDANPGVARLARAVREQVAEAAACRGHLPDVQDLDQHHDLVDTLMLAVFPPATRTTAIAGAVAPFQRRSFYHTPRFAEVLLNKDRTLKQPLNLDPATLESQLTRLAYLLILGREYAAELHEYRDGPAGAGGVYFHRGRLPPGLVPALQPEFGLHVCAGAGGGRKAAAHRRAGAGVGAPPPPPGFVAGVATPACTVLEGFNVLQLVDVTTQEILSELKYDLLERDVLQAADRLEQIQEKLRVLFARPALQVGIAAYDERKKAFVDFGPQNQPQLSD